MLSSVRPSWKYNRFAATLQKIGLFEQKSRNRFPKPWSRPLPEPSQTHPATSQRQEMHQYLRKTSQKHLYWWFWCITGPKNAFRKNRKFWIFRAKIEVAAPPAICKNRGCRRFFARISKKMLSGENRCIAPDFCVEFEFGTQKFHTFFLNHTWHVSYQNLLWWKHQDPNKFPHEVQQILTPLCFESLIFHLKDMLEDVL